MSREINQLITTLAELELRNENQSSAIKGMEQNITKLIHQMDLRTNRMDAIKDELSMLGVSWGDMYSMVADAKRNLG